jgi:hypothetical protein
MKLKVETPPNLTGTAEQQLRQMHSYLFRMVEGLNVALGNLSETKPQESGSGNAYNELRALIGNTAESVKELRKEIDKENGETATIDPLQLMPVGYIYISSDPTSPAELFGGTWEALTDRVIVGAGGKYDVNSTGGAETHTLTVNEMPSHNHGSRALTGTLANVMFDDGISIGANGIASITLARARSWSGAAGSASYRVDINATHEHDYNGGGAAHNNMQPYIAKYMWERTA